MSSKWSNAPKNEANHRCVKRLLHNPVISFHDLGSICVNCHTRVETMVVAGIYRRCMPCGIHLINLWNETRLNLDEDQGG